MVIKYFLNANVSTFFFFYCKFFSPNFCFLKIKCVSAFLQMLPDFHFEEIEPQYFIPFIFLIFLPLSKLKAGLSFSCTRYLISWPFVLIVSVLFNPILLRNTSSQDKQSQSKQTQSSSLLYNSFTVE